MYLSAASMISFLVLPFSFSSRLMRVTAAPSPIATAKIGSMARDMMYVGGAIFLLGGSRFAIVFGECKERSDSDRPSSLQPRPERKRGALSVSLDMNGATVLLTGHSSPTRRANGGADKTEVPREP